MSVEDVHEQAVEIDEVAADAGGRHAHREGKGGHGEAAGAEFGEQGAAGGDDLFLAVLLARGEVRVVARDRVDSVTQRAVAGFHGAQHTERMGNEASGM